MTLQNAPYFDVIPDEPIADAYWVNTADGVRLRIGVWSLENAKGTILLFPGRTEYLEKYAINAADFQKRGYAVTAIDWRGQGIADRLVSNVMAGYVENFGDYQKDLAAWLEAIEKLDLPKPYHLLGHSMGGQIGLRALYEGLPVNAAAFSGPMWDIQHTQSFRGLATAISSAAKCIGIGAWLAPGTKNETYVLDTEFEDNLLTTDRSMYARLQAHARANPDLMIGGPALRWLNEALRDCASTLTRPAPATPTLVVLGTDEEIVSKDAIHNRLSDWTGSELMMIESGRHETLMENQTKRDKISDAICALFDAHR